MKKNTFFLCLLCIAFLHAQDDTTNTSNKLIFEKGTQFINLNFSLNSATSDFERQGQDLVIDRGESESFGFSINASYAYAISNDWFIGLGVGYANSNGETKVNNVTTNDSDSKSYQIFPYVRYYKGIGKRLAIFIQGEARYSHFENTFNVLNNNDTDNFFFGIRPGITFMMSKNLAFETSIGSLGYTHGKGENNQNNFESKSNTFALSLNSSDLFFGLNYYF